MGKFLFGLIIGLIVGVVATAYNPNLPRETRTALEELSAAVMRGTERVAEAVGGAADEAAEQAGDAAREVEREITPDPGAPGQEPAPANPPPAPE